MVNGEWCKPFIRRPITIRFPLLTIHVSPFTIHAFHHSRFTPFLSVKWLASAAKSNI
jgi:hypothetical protein